jgi:DNA recombination protein RmuC
MEILLIIILAVLIVGLSLIYFQFAKKKKDGVQDQSLLLLQNQIGEISKTIDAKLGQSHQSMQIQFGQTAQIIKDVTEKLTKLDETNKQVIGFADQLKNLQDILKNPKQRGILGEYYLENVLKNVLPPKSYQMQYAFKDGVIVDAVVFVKDKIIPIDSKFSLENYQRILAATANDEKEKLEKLFKQDLKNRIDETSKYIKPSEGTMDFAFMFIPSEAIYYDLLINKVGAVQVNTQDLIEYAFKDKHVIIVSPTSFLAYLQTVLQGLRALQIEESAKEIRQRVEQLGKHLLSYNEYLGKLGNNLGTTVNSYNAAAAEFKKIDKDVIKIAGGESKIDVFALDKPKNDM